MTDETAPRYEIRTLADFSKVPEDRVAACLEEFAVWVEMQRNIAVVLHGIELRDPAFIWTDDGAPGVTYLRIDSDGGEVLRIDKDGWHGNPEVAHD